MEPAPQAGVQLEQLSEGALVNGIVPGEPVTVVATAWHGQSVITLTFRRINGSVEEQLVYRDDEPRLSLEAAARRWAFDGDGSLFRLVSEARRIRLAHLFDPMLAVHLSVLEPLPHQIEAVYGEMLPRQPLRFLLADDPGAGKTIMAGLYIKELILRADLARCLIVAPGSLVAQWQDELAEKFGLHFDILTRELIESTHSANPFVERSLLIARLDHLSRNEDLHPRLAEADWDLVVVDEAHRMSAHYFGTELKETKRYRLGVLLGSVSRNFLLMTATPHAGKEEDFQLFMALLDADRFEGRYRDGVHTADVSDLMRRMIKEKLLRFDGRPLFPERLAYTVPYPLSDLEARLYADVTKYVTEEMNHADNLAAQGEGRRGNRVGFAVTVLQRRLASSPEAIYQSLSRRRKRLEGRIMEERARRRGEQVTQATHLSTSPVDELDVDLDDLEDMDDAEVEGLEEQIVDEASSARTIAELELEIRTLVRLEKLAYDVRGSGTDRKWMELAALLTDKPEMRDHEGRRRKLIIFTEHRDTLKYLVERLQTFLGRAEAVVAIHGGVGREERRRIQELFTQEKDCLILVATDAAGEGINLQRAHLLINYDLPWNPNRIEQRFGRVHRIGQTEVCHMWNLVAEDTREGQVYTRLLEKLEEQRKALGGQVFNVLGDVLPGRALRELLIEAVRYGDRPEIRAKLDQVIDATVGEGLSELVAQHALAADVMSVADVDRIRVEMEEAQARRLQPHYIRSFFLEAFNRLGGRAVEREAGRLEITHVPADIRARDRSLGSGAPLLRRYQRVTFDKALVRVVEKPLAELITPGHPLLEAVVDLITERFDFLLKQGTIFVDEADCGEDPRVLVYLEHAIVDARDDGHGGRRVVSRRYQFVELAEDGSGYVAGYAPYLDYRPASAEERGTLERAINALWLTDEIETKALNYAVTQAVPAHLVEVKMRTQARVQKAMVAVKARLTKEIGYWDHRATTLLGQMQAGKQPRMNPDRAQARADDLSARLKRRMADLEREQQLQASPPTVVGGALVVPRGLLERLEGDRQAPPHEYAKETARVERRALDAVLAAEERLSRAATEMPHNNPGFDIRSLTPDGHILFIEVKGRIAGAPIVTVTRNEILHGLNSPEQFVLALVEVGSEGIDTVRYLRRPFSGSEDTYFPMTSVNYTWRALWERAEAPS
jgi:superfamily II DNA or RNA helicase